MHWDAEHADDELRQNLNKKLMSDLDEMPTLIFSFLVGPATAQPRAVHHVSFAFMARKPAALLHGAVIPEKVPSDPQPTSSSEYVGTSAETGKAGNKQNSFRGLSVQNHE